MSVNPGGTIWRLDPERLAPGILAVARRVRSAGDVI
jgi:hypothetical protein